MMRIRMLLPAMLLGMLLALGAFSGACGGDSKDDPLTLEEYFQKLDVVENDFRAAQEAVDFAALGDEPAVDDVVELLAELRDAVDEFVADLKDIDPPEETAAAHEETIAGFQVASDAIGDALDAADSATTADEIFALFEAPEVVEAETALDASCNALQTLATDNGISVDLGCEN